MSVEYGSLRMAMHTVRCKIFGKSDLKRWSDLKNYEIAWDERTRLMAGLIPSPARVIEFGAGRRQLEVYLDPDCTYFPSDLVSRGPETIVCDLNKRPLPDLADLRVDVAVFGGVWEYVKDLPSILHWISQFAPLCIASYECAQSQPRTLQRLHEALWRTRVGWVNTYSEKELVDFFKAAGFVRVQRMVWTTEGGDEPIFIFRRTCSNQ